MGADRVGSQMMSVDALGRRPIRVGAVSYLNTKPLVYRLEEIAPRVELSFAVPSHLSQRLACGELDVALIPSIEYFRGDGYRVISDACIGCRGPVWSVKLLSRVPMDAIATLALDEGSQTSVALVQLLLWHRYRLRPQLLPLPLSADPAAAPADAVLVIGDRAIHADDMPFTHSWDLGQQWWQETQLPFVFAMWVARDGFFSVELARALAAARDAGVAAIEEIAQQEAPRLRVPVDACIRYLGQHLHYYLGSIELEGLARFRQGCEELGLLHSGEAAPRHSVKDQSVTVRLS